MKIGVVGVGYVGLVAGTCFAELGNDVICVDVDEKKIENLKQGKVPIYEPGLDPLVARNFKEERLIFTTDLKKAVEESDIVFLAVGTPMSEDGQADLQYVLKVAADIGKYMDSYKVIVNKSTVPVGTADKVTAAIKENQDSEIEFDVVSNPEFLREGCAIKDFMNPDRIVVGCPNCRSQELMVRLYKPIERTVKPIVVTDVKSAEMIKYASNAFLATKISFINEMANICDTFGANVKEVAKGMGLDTRIGPRFLQAGIGYGGSCFPKDVQALMFSAKNAGCNTEILDAVEKVNSNQKKILIPKVKELMGDDLTGKKIALLGLSFKPKTDDMRQAPSLILIDELKALGAEIRAYDPVAMDEAKSMIGDSIEYADNPYHTLEGVDAAIVVTEWDEFRSLDPKKIKDRMRGKIILDGRNIYEPSEMRENGFTYSSIGRQ